MADYKVTDTELTSIANAIRAKTGKATQIEFSSGFVSEINSITGSVLVLNGIHGSVLTGTDSPLASQGVNGDIYLKLLDHGTTYSTIDEAYIKQNGVWVTFANEILPYSELEIVPFSSGTDEQIINLINSAHAGAINLRDIWGLGDTRTIHINSFSNGEGTTCPAQDIDIYITSFDEYMSSGNVIQFDFKKCLSTTFRMNPSSSTSGGYANSEMYKKTLPALFNAMPNYLKESMIEFSVLAASTRGGTVQTIPSNKLALRSSVELFGSGHNGTAGEGEWVQFYDSNTKRQKLKNNSSSRAIWSNRSVFSNTDFCGVYDEGTKNYYSASSAFGVAPFGCL